jgi:CO dehydrogenase/acetyl-CoA synthase beta subunit
MLESYVVDVDHPIVEKEEEEGEEGEEEEEEEEDADEDDATDEDDVSVNLRRVAGAWWKGCAGVWKGCVPRRWSRTPQHSDDAYR